MDVVVQNIVPSYVGQPMRLFHKVKERDDEITKITEGPYEHHDRNEEDKRYFHHCIQHGCCYNEDNNNVAMRTTRGTESHQEDARMAGHLQSDMEMTSEKDCPKVQQTRRRQAMCNCLLGLDL